MRAPRADPTPYELTEWGGWICARGPEVATRQLARVPHAVERAGFVMLPPSRANCLAAEAVGAVTAVTDSYRELRAREMSVDPRVLEATLGRLPALERPLLPHQLEYISRALWQRAMFNGSEQGTGKTTPALALAAAWRVPRTLVLCTKTAAGEWAREAGELFSRPPFTVVALNEGDTRDRIRELERLAGDNTPTLVTVNWDVAHTLGQALLAYDPTCVICDESWRVKNRKTKAFDAVLPLARHAAYVQNLAGTPVGNDVGDFFSQLRLLDESLTGSDYWDWVGRYAHVVPTRVTNAKTVLKIEGCLDPAGLMRLIEPVWFRASKAICLDLPPKRYERVALDLTPAVRELYRQVERDGMAALGDPLSLAPKAAVRVRLHQIAGGHLPRLDEDPTGQTLAELPCPKLAWVEQWVGDHLGGDPTVRLIVWCRYVAELHRVATRLRLALDCDEDQVAELWGPSSNAHIDRVKASFNSRHPRGVRVIVAQVSKMCNTHNLQAGDYNIYFSNSWSYIERSQSEDRTDRYGRVGAVTYIDLLHRGTVDEDVLAALDRKEDLSAQVVPVTV